MLPVLFLNVLAFSSAARILAVIPTPSYSHQNTFWPIWKELSKRGHHVTVITTDPINDKRLSNLTEIDVSSAYELMEPVYAQMGRLSPFAVMNVLQNRMHMVTEHTLSKKKVQHLLKNETSFDVVVVEAIFPEFLAFGELLRCPTILISSLDAPTLIHNAMGNTIHPVTNPEIVLPFYKNLNFKERITSAFLLTYLTFKRHIHFLPEKDRIIMKYFHKNGLKTKELLGQVSMLFLNVHPALHGVRLQGPSTVTFGGMVHIRDPQPLPKDLQKYLDEAKEGVVYFSLGSNVKSVAIEEYKIRAILGALGELPYKVLWKFEMEDLPGMPSNVKVVKWTPQQDVLRHPNVKAFVTQGGLQSLEEAISTQTPLVVLPFYADQTANARRIEDKQVGKVIYHTKNGLTKDDLKNAILEVAANPLYRKNMKALAELILDEPMTSVEKVCWWTEYVIRNKGARYLRNHILDIPLYQYFMLDILMFLVALLTVLLLVLYLVYRVVKFLVCFIFRKTSVFYKSKKE